MENNCYVFCKYKWYWYDITFPLPPSHQSIMKLSVGKYILKVWLISKGSHKDRKVWKNKKGGCKNVNFSFAFLDELGHFQQLLSMEKNNFYISHIFHATAPLSKIVSYSYFDTFPKNKHRQKTAPSFSQILMIPFWSRENFYSNWNHWKNLWIKE